MMSQLVGLGALLAALLIGSRMPGVLLAGCLFTYQAGAVSGRPWLGSAYVACAAFISLSKYCLRPTRIRLTTADLFLGLLTLYLVVSTSWAPRSDAPMNNMVQLLLTIGGMYCIARFQSGDPTWTMRQFVVGATILGPIMCCCMLAQRLTDSAHADTRLLISNENASVVGLSMPLPLAMLAATATMFLIPSRLIAVGATGALAIVAYTSIISATRSVFLAFGAGLFVLLWMARRRIALSRYLMAMLLAVVGGIVLLAIIPPEALLNLGARFSGYKGQVGTDASSLERLYLWRAATDLFLRYPLLGSGYGSSSYFGFAYPHNMVLEIASTAGLVGAVLLAFWLGAYWVQLRRVGQRNTDAGIILASFATVSVVQMQVSFSFFMGRPLFLVCAIATAMASSQISARRRPTRTPAPRFLKPAAGRSW